MKDALYFVLTVGFFVHSWAYVRACRRLMGAEYVIGLLLSIVLLAYLGYALVRPETF